jgi:hypothetical protein
MQFCSINFAQKDGVITRWNRMTLELIKQSPGVNGSPLKGCVQRRRQAPDRL